jgi:NTE family protein
VEIGRTFSNWGQVSLSYAGGVGQSDLEVLDPFGVFEPEDFDLGAFTMGFAVDTLDRPDFPHRGSRKALGESENNDTVFIDGLRVNTWGRNTLGAWITAVSKLDDQSPLVLSAGGFLNLSGFQSNELLGRHVGVARALFYRRIGGGPIASLMNTPIYLGGSLEWGNVWNDSDEVTFSNFLLAGSAFLGAETVLGPVFFAGGYAEGGHGALYLFVGRPLSLELTSSIR